MEIILIALVMWTITIAIFITIRIFFILSLKKTLESCAPHNQMIPSGQLWLMLIPLFWLVWDFIVYDKMRDSLTREFIDRGWHQRDASYAYPLGLTTAIINATNFVISFIPIVSLLSLPLAIASLVCFIIYWVKIVGYGNQLQSRGQRMRWDDGDDEDDRPPPPPRRDDEYDRPPPRRPSSDDIQRR